jgi:ferredoxin
VKFTVDLTQCENHGQCTIAAPNLFKLDDEGLLSFRAEADELYTSPELTDGQVDEAGAAVDMCPMQAIALVD